jgi:hypothetical protein
MKNTIVLFLLFIAFPVFGQNDKYVTDTIVKLLSEYDYDDIVRIRSDTDYQVIAARRYFANTKTIHKEYIRIDKKTYRYWENDSLNENRLIANGNLIGNPDVVIEEHWDTITEIDPISYDAWTVSLKHFTLEKEGKWFESDSIFRFEGNYKNNKREGKWLKTKWLDEFDKTELVYKNGNLLSEIQLNLIKNSDFNAIKKGLVSGGNNWGVKKIYQENNVSITDPYSFKFYSKSHSKRNYGEPTVKNCDYTWTINEQLIIELHFCDSKEYYRLLGIFSDGIYLQSLNK